MLLLTVRRRRTFRRVTALAMAFALPLLTASACSSSGGAAAAGTVAVVASTDVYADIVQTIGAGRVKVTSFIDNPAQDPHSYEASGRSQLAISRARLVVENGGGYDDFVDRMRSAHPTDAKLINVVTLSGKRAPAGGELNEHVWYDFPTITRLASTVADTLATLEPAGAVTFRRNAAAFIAKVQRLEQTEAAIKAVAAGEGVAITEPVPLYLLQACGLVDKTPAAFSEAVEAGTDVSASVLDDTLGLFRDHTVRALVYNAQTSGPETSKVVDAAHSAGIPVVPVTETLPSGDDYLTWMQANLAAVQAAVEKK